MLDHDDYAADMAEAARREGLDCLIPLPPATVEEYRLTGMSPWEAVAILA